MRAVIPAALLSLLLAVAAPRGAWADAADVAAVAPSEATAGFARWAAASGDPEGRPFVVVDKAAAQVAVYAPDGQLQGVAPALVGFAVGDTSVPGIGQRKLSKILPEERTTPAGRFLASYGPAAGGKTVLWVDFADAISLHPVATSNPAERRQKRLDTPEPDDNRITYGCINVPAAFYEEVVHKAFDGVQGVVYVLPDTRPLAEVFPQAAQALGELTLPNPSLTMIAAKSGPE